MDSRFQSSRSADQSESNWNQSSPDLSNYIPASSSSSFDGSNHPRPRGRRGSSRNWKSGTFRVSPPGGWCVGVSGGGCTKFSVFYQHRRFHFRGKICRGCAAAHVKSPAATVGSSELLISSTTSIYIFLYVHIHFFLGWRPFPQELQLQLCAVLIKLRPMAKAQESQSPLTFGPRLQLPRPVSARSYHLEEVAFFRQLSLEDRNRNISLERAFKLLVCLF